jgi:hypothetical protein
MLTALLTLQIITTADSVTHVNISRGDDAGSPKLHGIFAGIIRWFMQRRLKAEAANVLQGLRRRLETGEPPPVIVRGSS